MNLLRKQLLIGLTVLGMGGATLAVQAQTPAAEGRHSHAATQEQRQARMGEHIAKRQAKLHDALKLSAAQEPAWAAFQAAIKPDATHTRPDHSAMAALPAPERMEKHLEMAKQHIAGMESHLAALKTFYAVLTPEQKKVFDEHTRRGHHMGHKQHMGHMKGDMKQGHMKHG